VGSKKIHYWPVEGKSGSGHHIVKDRNEDARLSRRSWVHRWTVWTWIAVECLLDFLNDYTLKAMRRVCVLEFWISEEC